MPDSYIGSKGLKKMLSYDLEELEMKNQEAAKARKQLLKIVFPVLYAKTEVITNEKFNIFLPEKSYIPGGSEDITYIRFGTSGGHQGFLWVWAEANFPSIRFMYNNISYIFTPFEKNKENIIITIDNDKIVRGDHGFVKEIEDYQKKFLGMPLNRPIYIIVHSESV